MLASHMGCSWNSLASPRDLGLPRVQAIAAEFISEFPSDAFIQNVLAAKRGVNRSRNNTGREWIFMKERGIKWDIVKVVELPNAEEIKETRSECLM